MFRFPKVKFAIIPIEGEVVSPSKKMILDILGIKPDSKFPAVYGLFFEKGKILPNYQNVLGNDSINSEIANANSQELPNVSENSKEIQKNGQFKKIPKELLDYINSNSIPKIKVIKCENMTENGLKSFLGSMNNLGSFAHCKQNQFISHKFNHKIINFLNLDSLESLLERSVHFERIILIYFSSKQSEKQVISLYSKLIRQLRNKNKSSSVRKRHRRRRSKHNIHKKHDPTMKFKNTEKQFYIFDKSRNEWPEQLKELEESPFYLFSIKDGKQDKNLIEFVSLNTLDELKNILSNKIQFSEAKRTQLNFLL
jgi:hypothetical protein